MQALLVLVIVLAETGLYVTGLLLARTQLIMRRHGALGTAAAATAVRCLCASCDWYPAAAELSTRPFADQ